MKFLLLCCLPYAASAQVFYTGGAYTQDFNSLDSGIIYRNYTNLPAGWVVSKGSYVWTTVTNGYSNNYGTYCFSLSAAEPDKAIGLVIGSTGQAYLGAQFRNATGVTLNSFSLSYFAEQWAKGATANDQVIPFEYSLDATNLTSGTFTRVNALDMHSINDGDGFFARLDGNAPANRQFLSATISGLAWSPGQDLWIRWRGMAYSFFVAHALAVDDLSFRAVPELQISLGSSSQLLLSWSTNYAGFALQSASSLNSLSWTTVTNSPLLTGNQFTVELNPSAESRFFRLHLQ